MKSKMNEEGSGPEQQQFYAHTTTQHFQGCSISTLKKLFILCNTKTFLFSCLLIKDVIGQGRSRTKAATTSMLIIEFLYMYNSSRPVFNSTFSWLYLLCVYSRWYSINHIFFKVMIQKVSCSNLLILSQVNHSHCKS